MPSDSPTVGEIRINFELHSFRDQKWFRLRSWSYRNDAMAAAEQLLADGTVDGARIVRTELYQDYDFTDSIVIWKRMVGEVSELDPMLPAVDVGANFYWRQLSDFYGESGREELRNQLGRYLDEKRISVLELLHSDRHILELDSAGTLLQGIIQKVAVAQAQPGKSTAAGLFKEMMALFTQLVLQLRSDAEKVKVPKLEPGAFVEVLRKLGEQFGADAVGYHALRTISAYLIDAKTWLEKLDRLGSLYEPDFEHRHLKIFDAIIGDAFSGAGPYRELLGEGSDRVTAINAVLGLAGGRYRPEAGDLPRGVAVINTLMQDGLLPRTRATFRRRFLREIHSRQPLFVGRGLMVEMEALNLIIRSLNDTAPHLARDEEVLDAIAGRAGRAITVQNVAEALGTGQKVSDKLAVLSRLATLTPGPFNKAQLFRYFRAAMPPDDLVRLCLRDAGNRLAAIAPLGEVMRVMATAPVDEATRAEINGTVDGTLFDIFKNDILQAPNKTYADRISLLIKHCAPLQLAEGRARALAVDAIGREFRNPKFLPVFRQRFRSEAECKETLIRVRTFLTTPAGAGGPPG